VIAVPALHEAPVPHRLPDAVEVGPLVEALPDAILFRVPNVARFLVRAGGPVLVERTGGVTDADLRCFRDGPLAAAAAVLRGELPLRAAAVAIGGRAVVLCGASTAGKSALAAALAQRGHAVLADAVTLISSDTGQSRFTVEPLAPETVLWPDSARELGLDEAAGRPVRPELAARAYRLGSEPLATPLAAIAVLSVDDATGSEPAVEPLSGGHKVQALLRASWHIRLAESLGLGTTRCQAAIDLAAAIPFVRVIRPGRGARLALLADLVEELVAAA
jgi:hypothetical protein